MARGKTLSLDLRERAVNAYENGEGTYQEIADRFCIGRTTLCDMVRLSRYAGTLEPIKDKRPRSDRKASSTKLDWNASARWSRRTPTPPLSS